MQAHPVPRTLTLAGAIILVFSSLVALASEPPSQSKNPAAPPSDSRNQKAEPVAPPASKESDRELMQKRMRLCRQRPELCVQHAPDKKTPDAPRSPAPDGAGK